MNKIKFSIFLIVYVFFFNILNSQTQAERENIVKDYDIDQLVEMSNKFSEEFKAERKRAFEFVLRNNLPTVIKNIDGDFSTLFRILDDGTPIYRTTYNAGSAITINSDEVYEGGTNGLSLSGNGINFGIWDGGAVRLTHQELIGRVTQVDVPDNLNSHATHVSGTMIASGIEPDAKGMSFEGSLLAYDFDNDYSEMTLEASNGMLISNHSYGFNPNSIPDAAFGAYLVEAYNVDLIAYNAQYYLPVYAVGNSNGALPPHNPAGNGYDLISSSNLAKNILSVANVLQVDNYVDASSVNIWGQSSPGPTDDGRIKPDISAKGRLTYSTNSPSDDSYSFKTGTSMAAPAVSGSLGLLQEHNNNLYGNYLTAASMKALVTHTAREAGDHPGPDYFYGWGLMDTSAAAEVITNKDFTSILEENILNEGDTYSITVDAIDPNTPLVVTIAWVDPPGPVQSLADIDDPTPRLVNDLDLKVTAPDAFTEFLPWTLSVNTPDAPAVPGNNIVDNIEKVEIENAQGQYIIEISHKGSLQDLFQNYTLVVSGVAVSEYTLTTDEAFKSFCQNDVATFDLSVNSIPSFSDTVILSQSGLPSSFNFSFSNSTITSDGTSVLSIDNLESMPSGDYPFTITASTSSESRDFQFSLNTRPIVPLNNVIMVLPDENNPELQGLSPTFEWVLDNDALYYELEISTTSNFDNIVYSEETNSNINIVPELFEDQTYYFRLRSFNDCSVSNYTSGTFTTKPIACEPLFLSTDVPVVIDDSAPSLVNSTVIVPDSLSDKLLEDINVTLNISHTSISDLIITLTSPEGTTITLLNKVCGSSDDVDVIFDDKGASQDCNQSAPALIGIIVPEDKLSTFYGESFNGTWTLSVEDENFQNGGTIDNFGIEFCYEETLSTNSNILNEFRLYPNPSNGSVNVSFNRPALKNSVIKIYDITGRQVESVNVKEGHLNETLELDDLRSGLYLVQLNSQNSTLTKKLIIK